MKLISIIFLLLGKQFLQKKQTHHLCTIEPTLNTTTPPHTFLLLSSTTPLSTLTTPPWDIQTAITIYPTFFRICSILEDTPVSTQERPGPTVQQADTPRIITTYMVTIATLRLSLKRTHLLWVYSYKTVYD